MSFYDDIAGRGEEPVVSLPDEPVLINGNKEAYTYLPNSIERFPKGEAMLSILKHAGLEARQSKFFFGVCRMYKCQK